MSRVGTGQPSSYSGQDEVELAERVAWATNAWDAHHAAGALPTAMTVTAAIEWSGSYNSRPNRTVRMDGLRLGPTMAEARRYWAAGGQHDRDREIAARTYGSTSWTTQIRKLTETRAGYAAADRAGLDVTRRTLTGWLSGEVTPSKANRARIAAAYGELREERAGRSAAAVGTAAAAIERELTQAIRQRYGAEVRLFNVEDLDFGR